MKTILLSAVLALGMVHGASATARHPKKPLEVPEYIRTTFDGDYPQAKNVIWKATPEFNEARAMIDGKQTSVFYDNTGELMGTTTEAAVTDLPKAGLEQIEKKYPVSAIGEIVRYDDNADNENDVYAMDMDRQTEVNYFVNIRESDKNVILRVDDYGDVSLFEKN